MRKGKIVPSIKISPKFFFLLFFLVLNICLFYKTPIDKIDFRELFKLLFPTLSIFFALFLNYQQLKFLFKILFVVLLTHIALSFLFEFIFNASIFSKSSDNRYYLTLLGRSAGETALAFYVLYVSTFYFMIFNNSLEKNKNTLLFLFFIVINVCILTQSRTWILVFAIFFSLVSIMGNLNNYKKLILYKSKIITLYSIVTIINIVYTGYFNILSQRMSHSLLSGRVEIWQEYQKSVGKLSPVEFLVGKNLERKTLKNEDKGIETSDTHNMFIDISQTYGILGCILLIFSYLISIFKSQPNLSLPIIIAFCITGFVMSPFKVPYLFYTNILLLIIPLLYHRRVSHPHP